MAPASRRDLTMRRVVARRSSCRSKPGYALLEQAPLDTFLPRCRRENASVVISAPLTAGILATAVVEGAPYGDEPALPDVAARVRGMEAVWRSHDAPFAAAAFQFPLTRPNIGSVIPGIASRASLWSDPKAQGLLRTDAPMPDTSATQPETTP